MTHDLHTFVSLQAGYIGTLDEALYFVKQAYAQGNRTYEVSTLVSKDGKVVLHTWWPLHVTVCYQEQIHSFHAVCHLGSLGYHGWAKTSEQALMECIADIVEAYQCFAVERPTRWNRKVKAMIAQHFVGGECAQG